MGMSETRQTTAESSPNLLRDIVVYIGRRVSLNGTRVQKLLYLVEAEYADRNGARLMDYEFCHNRFGMNSKTLEDRVLAMKEEKGGPLFITFQKTDVGMGLRIKVKDDVPQPTLPAEVKAACDFVIREYGSMPLTSLMHAAKRTLPFYGTEDGDKVDWSSVKKVDQCNHKLSENGRRILQRALSAGEGS